jgi:hypothetical protein
MHSTQATQALKIIQLLQVIRKSTRRVSSISKESKVKAMEKNPRLRIIATSVIFLSDIMSSIYYSIRVIE